ncbi:hypothetical protein HG530_003630 [Fusarium avenaceum]|nr:hypothetical protein HG530_003630 [Fusarium avenaceum]
MSSKTGNNQRHQLNPAPHHIMAPGSHSRVQSASMHSLNANSEPASDVWNLNNTRPLNLRDNGDRSNAYMAFNPTTNNRPWNTNTVSQSPSSSPSRTRNVLANNDSDYAQMTGGMSQLRMSNIPTTYNSAYTIPANSDNFVPSTSVFSSYRNHRSTPSRHSQSQSQSQSSPPFSVAHAASNSTQSQRAAQPYMSPYQVNNQAYSFNNTQGIDDSSSQFTDRLSMPLESRPFQFNPGSQPWNNDGSVHRSLELPSQMTSHYQPVSRGSIDRGTSSQAEQGNSSRLHTASSNDWGRSLAGRDARPFNEERRMSNQQATQHFPAYYANQFVYSEHMVPYAPGADARLVHQLASTQQLASLYGPYASGVTNLPQESEQTTRANAFIQEIVPRIKGNKSIDLNQLYEFIVACSGHPEVSRFIQNKLESANSAEKEKIFNGIGDDAVALMKDVYGNYVMQKLLEHGSQAQKARLCGCMRGHMFELSKNMYGCRVVQKAVDILLVAQLVELFDELREHIEEVMVHTHGNHVIQRAVQVVPQQHIAFIFEFCLENVVKLSQDQNGCRVVQRVLERCTEDERARILNTLRPKWENLIQHSWGNYVVQHVLEHRGAEEKLPIIELVKSNLVRFSKQKLASNVVEACIRWCTNEQRREILQIFLTPGADGTDTLLDVAGDQYGNYVIIRLDKKLGEHSPPENQALLDELRPRYEKLRTANNVMPKVLSTLGRVVEDASHPQNGTGRLQVEVDSAAPTPVLTNETNSPQSDGPLSANVSAIGVPSADMKTPAAPLQVQDHEA